MLRLTVEPPPPELQADAIALIESRLATADETTVGLEGSKWLEAALSAARDAGVIGTLTLEAEPASRVYDEITEIVGMHLARDMVQMRRPLPLGEPWALDVRAFRPGEDDDEWLGVNNRAFVWHPDQGNWTRDDLRARMAEPWFDAEGFLVHERDGHMAGFCWTKVHDHLDPPAGEIYVIGVDPGMQGRGLGRSLACAGLDHLADLGLTEAFLYVEADNAPALALYGDLGFTTHHRHRWWTADLG